MKKLSKILESIEIVDIESYFLDLVESHNFTQSILVKYIDSTNKDSTYVIAINGGWFTPTKSSVIVYVVSHIKNRVNVYEDDSIWKDITDFQSRLKSRLSAYNIKYSISSEEIAIPDNDRNTNNGLFDIKVKTIIVTDIKINPKLVEAHDIMLEDAADFNLVHNIEPKWINSELKIIFKQGIYSEGRFVEVVKNFTQHLSDKTGCNFELVKPLQNGREVILLYKVRT